MSSMSVEIYSQAMTGSMSTRKRSLNRELKIPLHEESKNQLSFVIYLVFLLQGIPYGSITVRYFL